MLQPVEDRADVVALASSMVMCSLAKSRSSEVEAQHRQSKAVQCLRGVIHNFVVHRSAVQRMGMAHQRRVGRSGLAGVQQRFQPPCGTRQKHRLNCIGHVLRLPRLRLWAHEIALRSILREAFRYAVNMDAARLTRELIDIESITGNEAEVGDYLYNYLSKLGYRTEKMPVEGARHNVYATIDGKPDLIFSTHMDTVPPFIPSSEDGEKIYGRGSCDAKGIIAAQIAAAETLRLKTPRVGLLFLVGEERDSQGAKEANRHARGSRFLINGEPTENRIGRASKGTLRVQLTANGRMAHSAYPHLGESAIEKLVEALHRLLKMPLPSNPEIGPATLNVGLIEGGRAPNVIPDFAQAQLLYRLVGPTNQLRKDIQAAVEGLALAEFALEIPYLKLRTIDGIPEMIAAFTTDIPALTNWGEPVLLGPGSIHVAHTDGEFISKRELAEAVGLYVSVAEKLLAS